MGKRWQQFGNVWEDETVLRENISKGPLGATGGFEHLNLPCTV